MRTIKITHGTIPQGAAIIGTVKACETCGAEMLLQAWQAKFCICQECADKLRATDTMGDTRNLIA